MSIRATDTHTPAPRRWRTFLRTALWHRRLLAAALAAAAVAAALSALSPPEPSTQPVLVAGRDLAWGTAVDDEDWRTVAVPVALVPDGVIPSVQAARGRLLAAPIRRGEALTDVRLVGPGLLRAIDGAHGAGHLVATPVRVADADAAMLLRPGDVVDVLAAADLRAGVAPGARRATAEVSKVAAGVAVLSVPPPGDEAGLASGDGALVVLATSPAVAADLAAAAATSRLSITLGSR